MNTTQLIRPLPFYGSALNQNPYATYRRLLHEGEIHYVKFPSGVCGWLVTGYDAAIKTLSHPLIGKSHQLGNQRWRALASIMPEPQHTTLQSHLLHQDPPKHTALRALILDAFAPARIELLREQITHIAHRLSDSICTAGQCDLIADFAAQLPLLVLSQTIGLAEPHRAQFKPLWCKAVQPVGPNDPGRQAYINLLQELQTYIDMIIAESRLGDTSRLIVRLIAAHDEEKISYNELTSVIFQLLVAGQEPMTNQIGNAMLALIQNPDQLSHLQRYPSKIEAALTELLRFDGAFALSTWRFFTQATPWLGAVVPAGDSVIVALNAANHDSKQFRCPHQLDFDRAPNKPLSFGYDHHYCPAAALARVELEISIQVILTRLPNIRLGCAPDELRWINAVLARGLVSLPVRYTATTNKATT